MKIPEKLAFVIVAVGLASCGNDPNVKQSSQSLCPPDWYCSSDAARAFNCTDMSSNTFESDLGFCEPPV